MSGTVAKTAEFLRDFGYQVSDDVVTMCQAAETDELLWLNPKKVTDGCLDPGIPVPPGHMASAGLRLGISVSEVCRRLAAHGLDAESGRLPDRATTEVVVLLSANGDGKPPWLDPTKPTPPGHVLHAVKELGLDSADVLAKLAALGIGPPEPFPADATSDDLWVLHDYIFGECLSPGRRLLYGNLFDSVRNLDDLRLRVRRLRAYGFDVALEVPRRPTSLDREILCENSPLNLWSIPTNEPVPFSHILLAAGRLGERPATIAKRLRACNIEPSRDNLPIGLVFSEALRLIRAEKWNDGDAPDVAAFPLQYLHDTALRRGSNIRRIAALLNDLGIPVPDPASSIRAALARVPRPHSG
ncbi:hypothetical protein ACFV29_41300 [Streptomyces sp. NPDC059690]|uniref:wHTH domain-containing protein n=1 Tax=Streptomyces sp. NPDC059690 TaxID=3346907 RepID=UPI003681B64D